MKAPTGNNIPVQVNLPFMRTIQCIQLSIMVILIAIILLSPAFAEEGFGEGTLLDPEDISLPFPTDIPSPGPDPMPGPIENVSLVPETSPSLIGGDIGWFQITSTPSGSQVFFDGSDIGATPARVRIYTTATPAHSVRVEKAGYKIWAREFNENPGAGETTRVHATLIPEICCKSLRITSAPSGAYITLNGVFLGYTPKTFDNLRYGTYQVTLSREGYEPWSRNIMVSPDEENAIYVVLEPMFAPITSGTLMVDSSPQGAEIILDEASRGKTPRSLTLPEGSHTLVINLAGYQPYEISIFMRDGENSHIYAPLIPTGSTPVPVITSPPISQNSFSSDELVHLGDNAADFIGRMGIDPFIAEVNRPGGEFMQDGLYVSVLAENGTLLADSLTQEWINENITSYSDQNTVPYGEVRIAMAEAEGGFLYENDISNTSPAGQVLITAVRPITDTLIIAVSSPLGRPFPLISSGTISSLLSGTSLDEVPVSSIAELIIPSVNEETGSASNEREIFNQTSGDFIRTRAVIDAMASQGGGLCYITEPSGTEPTLAYVLAGDDGMITVRWITKTGREVTENELIHS